jgi:hypothetical protein
VFGIAERAQLQFLFDILFDLFCFSSVANSGHFIRGIMYKLQVRLYAHDVDQRNLERSISRVA